MSNSTSFQKLKKNFLVLSFLIIFLFSYDISFAQNFAALGSGTDGSVRAVTVYNGELIVAGTFNTAGGITANRIAKWDGTSWAPLGQGMNGSVYALTVYNADLYAGGSFTTAGGVTANNVARWNGTSWTPLGVGTNSAVYCLDVFTNSLILGGSFTTAGGNTANRIARWNGNWDVIGAGTNGTVYSMAKSGNQLYFGGIFTTVGGVTVNRITCWDGVNWFLLNNGIDNGYVYALFEYDSTVVIGGYFTSASGVSANNIASWNGTGFSSFSTGMSGGSVRALNVYLDDLYAGGFFTSAGGVTVDRIAKWNGSTWSTLGGINGPVRALDVYDATLITGGNFSNAGGVSANRIAKWGSVPVAPVLVSPPNVSTQVSLIPTLDWDTVYNAFTYGVQISIDPNFASLIIDTSGLRSTNYQVPPGILNLGTIYFWRANARNGMGLSPWSVTWFFTTTPVNISLISSEIPDRFRLYTNYPNPFNPSTKIKFDIPENSYVSITVYDALGRKVEGLLNQSLSTGAYITNWNADKFSSGVYYYRMEATPVDGSNIFMETRRMVLLK